MHLFIQLHERVGGQRGGSQSAVATRELDKMKQRWFLGVNVLAGNAIKLARSLHPSLLHPPTPVQIGGWRPLCLGGGGAVPLLISH